MEPQVSKQLLIDESLKIHRCAESNLRQLNGLCIDPELTQDYFMGILRRQSILTLDLNTILQKSPTSNLTTPAIICRCLIDDFLHVFYLFTSDDQDEIITKINAEANSENFKALEGITTSNHKHFEGGYIHYLTGEQLENLKSVFSSKAENKKFFVNVKEFKFKKFMTNAELANSISDFELSKLAQRALFIWKQFSSFTHFSNATLEFELSETNRDIFLSQIEETLLYSYNTIKFAFSYFEHRNNLKFNDLNLDDRYRIEMESR